MVKRLLTCSECGARMTVTTEGVVEIGAEVPSVVKLRCENCDITRFENRADIERELAEEGETNGLATASKAPPCSNGLATASMVLGLIGIFTWVIALPQVLAIVFGHISRAQIAGSQGEQRGARRASVGLWLGYLELIAFIAFVIAGILGVWD